MSVQLWLSAFANCDDWFATIRTRASDGILPSLLLSLSVSLSPSFVFLLPSSLTRPSAAMAAPPPRAGDEGIADRGLRQKEAGRDMAERGLEAMSSASG